MAVTNNPSQTKKVTLKDVAKEAGVSVTTASYVLNRQKSFSEQTKARVHEAAARLQYRPNYSAQAMRTGRTKTIGLVIPTLQDPFFPEFAKAVENSAHRLSYSVILVDTQQNRKIEEESAIRLIEHGVDGIIWCPMGEQDTFARHRKTTPLVVVDRPLPKSDYDVVCSDYVKGGELIADLVVELGHREIGLITGPNALQSTRIRHRSFKNRIGDKADILWQVENPLSPDLNTATQQALRKNQVSLVVAGNDLIAIGAIMCLKSEGIKVPDEVSVIGFDGTRLSQIVSPELTTVRQPLADLGQEAVNLLLNRIGEPGAAPRQKILDVQLIGGRSAVSYGNPSATGNSPGR